MKTLATTKRQKPYAGKVRRGERPYQYSEQYGHWRRAIIERGDVGGTNEAWRRRFAPSFRDGAVR